jgi:hypothetical protein
VDYIAADSPRITLPRITAWIAIPLPRAHRGPALRRRTLSLLRASD